MIKKPTKKPASKKRSSSISAKIKIRENKYVVIYFRNKMFKTGILLNDPKTEFNDGLLTAKYKGKEDYTKLNTYLKKRLLLINKLIIEASEKGIDSLDYINLHFNTENTKLKNLVVNNDTPIIDAFSDYLNVKYKRDKDEVQERSFQRYQSELSRLKDYHKTNYTTLSDLQDIQWFKDFAKWLTKPYQKTFDVVDKKYERSYKATKTLVQTNSTIKRFLQDLITFCKSNKDTGIQFPIDELNKYIASLKTSKDNSNNILALSKKQYNALLKFKPRFDWHKTTLDAYIFSCNTGLRYSDLIKLFSANVKNNTITMMAEKTDAEFSVRMNETALEIFGRYNRDFRNKFPVNQQININLRKIMSEIDEFNDERLVYKYTLNKNEQISVKTFEIISFHSSRRTFVSNCIRNGASIAQIQKFTGWSKHDLRTITHYMTAFGDDENDLDVLKF